MISGNLTYFEVSMMTQLILMHENKKLYFTLSEENQDRVKKDLSPITFKRSVLHLHPTQLIH